MCQRLECMKHLWTQTNSAGAGATPGNNNFWAENDGAVKNLWDELAKAMKDNTTEKEECNKVGNKGTEASPSEKAACNYLHAGLEHLYKTPASSSTTATPSVLNNPSFRQTMGCFLLHAYAKHMKEKATCLIDAGISKAFELGENLSKQGTCTVGSSGKGQCVPCQWNNDWGSCEIKMNGSSVSNEKVQEKLKEIVKAEDNNIVAMAKQVNNVTELCDQVKCVANKWLKVKGGGKTDNWEQVWSEVKKEIPKLGGAISTPISKDRRTELENYCTGIQTVNGKPADKEACLLIAAGLKNLYDIKDGDDVEKSFKRTMRCVLLNAIADKLQDNKFPCKDEKKVAEAITKAFKQSATIMGQGEGCNKNDKCFECKRVPLSSLTDCNLGSPSNSQNLKSKIEDDLLKEGENIEMTKIKEKAIKDICKPCDSTGDTCTYVKCVADKWKNNRGHQNNDKMWDDVGAELSSLLNDMKSNRDKITDHCNQDSNGQNWEAGAAGGANKVACQLVAAGLQHISGIQRNYTTKGSDQEKNPYDNQEFKQFASCLMLNSVVREMKRRSMICDISEGIETAFSKAGAIKEAKCRNGKPCFVCKLEDNYDDCTINNGKSTVNVKDKLNELDKKNTGQVNTALTDITTTPGNKGSLCSRLQCLASRVQAEALKKSNPNAKEFWEKEVKDLWTELSTAITGTNANDTSNGCGTMDDVSATGTGGRSATNPERKACNYLHAGLKKLYDMTTGSSTTSTTSSSGDEKILDKNPLLKQTVGCLLLHAYAKQMKSDAKCLVESGIKKAFEKAGTCNSVGSSRTEPCVPCEWNEEILTTCQITLNGTEQTPVKEKLTHVQEKINTTSSSTTKNNINLTPSLCDQLQCAAPKWFENQNKQVQSGGATTNKTWCDFWNDGVKKSLQAMFNDIATEGKNNPTSMTIAPTCKNFGDGNDDSVERKACNHIAAGLQHIKGITGSSNGVVQSNDQYKHLLARAAACIALNMYADQIREKSKDKCPIDESKIQRMFNFWNAINNNSCLTSASRANNKDCFVCKRLQGSDFADCKLSVSNTLVDTTSSPQSGTCNNDSTKVTIQVDGLLKKDDKSIPEVNKTLSTINEMNTFCSELQCAAKQYHKNKHNGGQFKTTLSWDEISGVVDEQLKKLLEDITNEGKWNDVSTYCDKVGLLTDNDGEKRAKQKACKLFALGLKHISSITEDKSKADGPLKRTMMCAALNLYADQLIEKSTKQCPLDDKKLGEAIDHAFDNSKTIMNGGTSCKTGSGTNSCFICQRQHTFPPCQIGKDKIGEKMNQLITDDDNNKTSTTNSNTNNTTPTMDKTLEEINKIETFCTQVQCAIKQKLRRKNKLSNGTEPSWKNIEEDATKELKELLEYMSQSKNQEKVNQYCKDNEDKWNKIGHKEGRTNKAACLLFASGLKHIYTHDNGRVNGRVDGRVNGPSFGQTMGCLFLKEYAKQLQTMANEKKKGHSWVHPLCDIEDGITYAFGKSGDIMNAPSQCNKDVPNSCFECKWDKNDYDNCSIGTEEVNSKVKPLLQSNENHMQQTLENTVCPILLTDLLTPFLPLAPVSIGLSAMAYYLWKYFGPLGKGGPRFRRSPTEIPGPSVQEQVHDHVDEAGPHEYRLVKERKPRSAPTRTKRSGPVNRRTIIEIHFEVLDECQKGDTQFNQKDFLELLVEEFMGSEFMEVEQFPKENVLMEGVPMESVPMELVPIEEVPSLGSGLLV
ncbi:SICAvar type I [Plasmodium knowlesi]|uniref:SICAvar type I n=2 Tax=Plasmodium knowlesi TaxID=5850 RepID=A0A1Y3DNC5_PLAKN|nr:SICAvar type I [Plasmodium knowlesi]